MASNLPPGVTDAMIDALCGPEMPDEELTKRLDAKIAELSASELLALIPSLRDRVDEFFMDKVYEEWEDDKRNAAEDYDYEPEEE